ncbi:peptidase S8/S53 domain-containing protein [Lactarius quietus]|nr:peptidase S8/S53 domain-containing protein [Lactarius quietus]
MMCYLRFLFLSAAVTASLAELRTPLEPAWHDTHVKHTWNSVPNNWESLGCPPDGTTIDLYVALKPHRENALISSLYEVSDPRHPKYGAHLSKEQVAELIAPHPETLKLVNSWLEYHGVSSSSVTTTHGGNWLTLTGIPVPQANELLGASYQHYRHTGTNVTILRTIGYSLPTILHTLVQTIAPTTCFASVRTLRQTTRKHSVGAEVALANVTSGEHMSDRDNSLKEIGPEELIWLYQTFGYVPIATGKNKFGIMGFGEEGPSQADLTQFVTRYFTNAEDATYTVEPVNGGHYDQSKVDLEASLDMQYSQAFVYPTPIVYYSISGKLKLSPGSNEPAPGDSYLEWFKYVLNQATIPQTILAAIGGDEKDFPLEYAKAVCDMFAQLGSRGVSVIFASGDDGVGPEDPDDCMAKDGSPTVQFVPVFPATCPYVTTVGGTESIEESMAPEAGTSLSGGGFSFYFPRPDYQDDAVPPFIKSIGTQHKGLYDPAGRGIPDISAHARGYQVVEKGELMVADGTSCAAPTVAGIISLLNDYQLSKGRAPLGFLNPLLYGYLRKGFTDIKSGSNPGCGTPGFAAVPGWDPVTGLGTPDFSNCNTKLIMRRFPLQQVLHQVLQVAAHDNLRAYEKHKSTAPQLEANDYSHASPLVYSMLRKQLTPHERNKLL